MQTLTCVGTAPAQTARLSCVHSMGSHTGGRTGVASNGQAGCGTNGCGLGGRSGVQAQEPQCKMGRMEVWNSRATRVGPTSFNGERMHTQDDGWVLVRRSAFSISCARVYQPEKHPRFSGRTPAPTGTTARPRTARQ